MSSLSRVLMLCGGLLGASVAAAAPMGWRYDGTGVAQTEGVSWSWSEASATWTRTLPAWGNSTPVILGGQLCLGAEPTTVLCVDAASGEVTWQASNDVVDTLSGEAAAARRAELAAVPALEEGMRDNQRRISKLRRDARRGDEAAAAEIPAVSAALDEQKRQYDALSAWLTPPTLDVIGYMSSTPVTDGTSLFVMAGNGVVSKFSADGVRKWSVWLGAPPTPMLGYDVGSVSSPLLVGGLVIVGHGHLQARSVEDGSLVWSDEAPWLHYGTPALATIAGQPYLVLPDGRVLRAVDGVEVTRGPGEIWYTGATVLGDKVWLAGSKGSGGQLGNSKAWAWQLQASGSGEVRAKALWSRDLIDSERVYAASLVYEGLLYVLTRRNHLMVLDAETGEDVYDVELGNILRGDGYQSIVAVNGHVVLGCESAEFVVVKAGRTYQQLHELQLGGRARATPVFHDGRAYVRTLDKLMAFGR